jgi:hypothetical protein
MAKASKPLFPGKETPAEEKREAKAAKAAKPAKTGKKKG